jgi:hypothetical protein
MAIEIGASVNCDGTVERRESSPPRNPGKRRRVGKSQTAAVAGKCQNESARKAATKEATGELLNLDQNTFFRFYVALGLEFLIRTGRAAPELLVNLLKTLPSTAADRFRTVRRCTFSWLTDRTTLAAIAANSAQESRRHGAEALRTAVLSQCVLTSSELLTSLDAPVLRKVSAERLAQVLRRKLDEEARRSERGSLAGKTARRSPISPGLQTGVLSCLGRDRGGIVDKVSRFVEDLNERYRDIWKLIDSGEDVVRVLRLSREQGGGLRLPRFRAHCVSRLLWIMTAGERGTSPSSTLVGPGAHAALDILIPATAGGNEVSPPARLTELTHRLREFYDSCRSRSESEAGDGEERDESEPAQFARLFVAVVDRLEHSRLHPLSCQTVEHILCEARKVFGTSRRPRRGEAKAGYRELFERASPSILRCPQPMTRQH